MVNKILLGRERFILKIHLRQPGFTNSGCGPYTKNKERIKFFKKQVIKDIFIETN